MTNGKPIEILLVEDNSGDLFLTKKAFEKAKILNNIHVAKDGEIAMNMLNQKDEFKDFVRPDIILLDINLPKKSGQEVLAEIKEDKELRKIPVVVLTSSQAEADIAQSYEKYASGYISKPISLKGFQEVVTAIEGFWFNIVILPKDA